ncbi:hypothetical protein TNCV_3395901 [Trichonephila clavipes]|nr:hypothetical protein TNCV_3395901 [Trichonephila clavipes]
MKLVERLIEEGGSDSGSRNFASPNISENVVRLVGRHFPSYVESDYSKKNIAKMCVVYSASTPQVWGSINGLRQVDSAFYPRYIGSINEYQACLGSQPLKVSLQTDHQIGTSVHAPQRPMVTCIMMGTVVPGPHGLLCF